MTEHKRLVENIQTKMAFYVSNLRISNDRDYFDENKEAEYFFCKPLSLLFDADVTNVNSEQRNFPGIDLADRKEGICFQITSTNTKRKIQHTLDEFLEHKLDDDFDRLIVLIVTLEDPPKCANLKFKRPFDFDVKRDVWNISRLVQEFADLPADKRHLLQAFSDYLDQEMPNIELQKPHLELPLGSRLQPSGFVGREEELENIRSRFAAGDKLVVLTGLGGMGKTELAVRFGKTYTSGAVYFTRFSESFTRTLANMANGIQPKLSQEELSRPAEALCKMIMDILGKCGEHDLLIIDNVDADRGRLNDLMQDPAYRRLTALELRLLLTTRFECPQALRIAPMGDEMLYQIFEKYEACPTRQEMKALIDAVNGHTLTIDLIARTLADNWEPVSAAEMLTELAANHLDNEAFAEVESHYNQSLEQVQIYWHLQKVFQVAQIPWTEQNILRCATLLPQSGMNFDLFRDSLPEDWRRSLAPLGRRGWLTKEGNLLSIHPVIRAVCWGELKPNDENCKDFLESLWLRATKVPYNGKLLRQLADLFATASKSLHDVDGGCCLRTGLFLERLGKYGEALKFYREAAERQESHIPNSSHLARTYNKLGASCLNLSKPSDALEYFQKALHIVEKNFKRDEDLLATTYNNIGHTYSDLGQFRDALEYGLLALNIRKSCYSGNHLAVAACYNNVGSAHLGLGDWRQALDYKLQALAIREKVLPPQNLDLAKSYNNVGSIYLRLGNISKAREFLLKALWIREQVLPKDHPTLATSYNNVGCIYLRLGNHAKALEYLQKALQIRETVLPKDHLDIAETCSNIAVICCILDDYSEAMKYSNRAIEVAEKVLPPNHPDQQFYRTFAASIQAKAEM